MEQTIAALVIVACAALWLARSLFGGPGRKKSCCSGTETKKKSCGGGCSCG